MLEQAADLIETKLTLLGATAIEDQLQDQVRNMFNLSFSFLYQFVKKINMLKLYNYYNFRYRKRYKLFYKLISKSGC